MCNGDHRQARLRVLLPITEAPQDGCDRLTVTGGLIVGMAGILGAAFALMQAQGWHFGQSHRHGWPDIPGHRATLLISTCS
jgi:hypothetical protein